MKHNKKRTWKYYKVTYRESGKMVTKTVKAQSVEEVRKCSLYCNATIEFIK